MRRTILLALIMSLQVGCSPAGGGAASGGRADVDVSGDTAVPITASAPGTVAPAPAQESPLVDMAWSPSVRIGAEAYSDGFGAVTAPDGTAMVVWAGRTIRSREARPGQAWKPTRIVPGSGEYPDLVGVGVDRAGTVTLIWMTEEDQRYHVFVAVHSTGESWSRPQRIASGLSVDLGTGSDMAVAPNGAVVVALNEIDGGQIRAVYRRATGEWTKPETLATPSLPFADVAIDPRGVATAAFLDDGNRLTLVQRTAQGWQEPLTLSEHSSLDFDLDAGRAGEVVVVWKSNKAYYAGRLSDGAWSSRQLTGAGRLAGARVEAAVDGSATFVWTSHRELHSVYQSSSGAVADEVVISALGPRYSSATLVSDKRGNVLAFWTAASQIFVARSDGLDPAWSEPSDVNEDYSGVDAYLDIAAALAADGSVLIVWQDINKMQDGVDGTMARRGRLSG